MLLLVCVFISKPDVLVVRVLEKKPSISCFLSPFFVQAIGFIYARHLCLFKVLVVVHQLEQNEIWL